MRRYSTRHAWFQDGRASEPRMGRCYGTHGSRPGPHTVAASRLVPAHGICRIAAGRQSSGRFRFRVFRVFRGRALSAPRDGTAKRAERSGTWQTLTALRALLFGSRATIGVFGALAVLIAGCAQPPGPKAAPPAGGTPPAAAKQDVPQEQPVLAAERKIELPGIVVDLRSGEVRIDGEVCIEQGILEYIAVGDGGKAYESLFALACRASHLHAAMLIAGYQAGAVSPELRGDFAPNAPATTNPAAHIRPEGAPRVTAPPPGQPDTAAREPTRAVVDVEVRQADGTWQRRPIESFLIDRRTNQPPARLEWAFTGSFFHRDPDTQREYFVADAEKSLVALWYDPTCLLNLTQDVGNPYRGDASGLQVDKDRLPPKGTPIRLILRRR